MGFLNQVYLTFWFLGNDTMLLKSTPELVDTFFDAAKRVWDKNCNYRFLLVPKFIATKVWPFNA